jgi:hypothetical protein
VARRSGVDGFDVLTTKHNASDAAEVARAQAEGAFVTDNNYGKRVNGARLRALAPARQRRMLTVTRARAHMCSCAGLLVTRSLGDLGCEGTISTPAYRVASVDRRPCVVVMGSDGVRVCVCVRACRARACR